MATPNPEASQIGLAVLQKGGNAADAAIAVSFALSVLRPQSTGLGGGGFLLFYDAKQEKVSALDFREFAPQKAFQEMYLKNGKADSSLSQDGALAVAVPRLLAGLGYVYEHYAGGKISWEELIRPSIVLAAQGFEVYPHLAEAIEERKEILSRFPSSRAVFLAGGKPLQKGEKLVQADLAKTLKTIAQKGWASFYEGEIAASLVRTLQAHGGIITAEDLRWVEPIAMLPVEGTYRGYRIVSMPPPSSGGVTLIETLNILEHFPLARRGPYHVKTVHAVIEAMKRAFLDRSNFLGDPRFVKIPLRGLLAKEYAEGLAESISMDRATPAGQLSPVGFDLKESGSTTHFSIVDGEGNAVSSTQTINYLFGSGLVAEGTGIVLNDEMDDFSIQPGVPNVYGLVGSGANAIAPGKIPLSSMSPTFVFNPKGELLLALGSPGGPKIITAVLDTILNQIDFKATPLNAVAAKRYHHQWLPDRTDAEKGIFPPELMKQLGGMGHQIQEGEFPWLVMLVARTKEGWVGVSDPRGIGIPMGY